MNSKVRIALDVAVVLWLLALAFYAGGLAKTVEGLKEAISTRGGVQISIEASNRLTALESKDERHEMRLLEIERQLRGRE